MALSEPQFLEWRIRIFGVGAIIGLFGMFAKVDWMVSAAIVVLAIGVILGLVNKRRSVTLDADAAADDASADDAADSDERTRSSQ